ncbi:hypothetical protein DFH11DRAFT_1559046 [Phellopilus nigrolimitatus]|nr:hypothetical protein DFH11DRAFT_1559046 [Phellopilus nigrolimitatus]
MGIDAEGRIDPIYLRHTLDLILQACLPAEDQESDAERAIIREVVAKVVSKDVVPTLCQPWFIHKLMLDQLRSSAEAIPNTASATETPVRATGPSINTAIIFVLSAVQYLSGLCLTLIQLYKQTVHTVKVVNNTPELPKTKEPREFGLHLLRCASEVLNIRERVAASAVFDILEALLGVFDSFIDRLLVYLLQTFIMTEHRVITIVKLSKQTLFPGGYPGPPPVIPTPEEQVLLKEQLVRQIEEHIPSIVSTLVLGPAPAERETIVSALEPLSSEACNAHLVVFLLDLLVLALFPELGAPMPVDDDEPPSPSTDAGDAPSVLSRRASSLEEGEACGSPGSPLSMGD